MYYSRYAVPLILKKAWRLGGSYFLQWRLGVFPWILGVFPWTLSRLKRAGGWPGLFEIAHVLKGGHGGFGALAGSHDDLLLRYAGHVPAGENAFGAGAAVIVDDDFAPGVRFDQAFEECGVRVLPDLDKDPADRQCLLFAVPATGRLWTPRSLCRISSRRHSLRARRLCRFA